jgi:hypothetical protein
MIGTEGLLRSSLCVPEPNRAKPPPAFGEVSSSRQPLGTSLRLNPGESTDHAGEAGRCAHTRRRTQPGRPARPPPGLPAPHRPPGDQEGYTPAEVAAAIKETAGERIASGTYLWQLRTGRKDNPTYKVLMGLGGFFGVSPTYFFEDGAVECGTLPPDVVTALQAGTRVTSARSSGGPRRPCEQARHRKAGDPLDAN